MGWPGGQRGPFDRLCQAVLLRPSALCMKAIEATRWDTGWALSMARQAADMSWQVVVPPHPVGLRIAEAVSAGGTEADPTAEATAGPVAGRPAL